MPRAEEGMRRSADGQELPQKRFFRQRAHINPLSFTQTYTLCVRNAGAVDSPLFIAVCETLSVDDYNFSFRRRF